MATVKERLDEVKKCIDCKCWRAADKKIDAIYEDYCSNPEVKFTFADDNRMFKYLEIISKKLYCEKMAGKILN